MLDEKRNNGNNGNYNLVIWHIFSKHWQTTEGLKPWSTGLILTSSAESTAAPVHGLPSVMFHLRLRDITDEIPHFLNMVFNASTEFLERKKKSRPKETHQRPRFARRCVPSYGSVGVTVLFWALPVPPKKKKKRVEKQRSDKKRTTMGKTVFFLTSKGIFLSGNPIVYIFIYEFLI